MANNENDFENEDLNDFDDQVDFGEFDSDQPKRNSVGAALNSSPVVKFGLVGAAVLVVIAAVALFGGEKEQVASSTVKPSPSELKVAPGTDEVTPSMRDALEENNDEKYNNAIKNKTSSISTPIDPPKIFMGVPTNETAGEDPLVRWKKLQEERLKIERANQQLSAQGGQPDPNRQARLDALREAMGAQMNQALAKSQAIRGMNHIVVTQDKLSDSQLQELQSQLGITGQPGAFQASAQTGGANSVPAPEKLKIIIPAGEVEYSQLMLEANSDIPGPLVAMIVSGPFSGSKVLGSFSKQEEYLTMQFNTLVNKSGNSVPISAIAVDPETTLTALATDVDHRYWSRVILPAAASFVSGLGQAIADNGKTTVTVNGETVAQQSGDLNTKEELSKAAAVSAEKVSGIIDDEASKTEILVRVRAGTPMGLLFMQPVTEQDVKGSQYAPVVQQQQAATPFIALPQGYTGDPMTLLQQGLGTQQFLTQPQQPGFPTTTSSVPMTYASEKQ